MLFDSDINSLIVIIATADGTAQTAGKNESEYFNYTDTECHRQDDDDVLVEPLQSAVVTSL